jgi:hypothetical protein
MALFGRVASSGPVAVRNFVSLYIEEIETLKKSGKGKVNAISLTSEPQRPVAMTRTMTSRSDWSVGLLRSSKANVPPLCNTNAWLAV